MARTIRGRVWKFGDNIDTDAMAPFQTLTGSWEETKTAMLPGHRDFTEGVKPGDVIVAGRNWGCGSSREHAAENLKKLGLGAVVADSFARIYFRNCVAIAFPNLACPGVSAAFEQGDEIEIDLPTGRAQNLTRGTALQGSAYTEEMLRIVEGGGLLKVLEQRVKEGTLV